MSSVEDGTVAVTWSERPALESCWTVIDLCVVAKIGLSCACGITGHAAGLTQQATSMCFDDCF